MTTDSTTDALHPGDRPDVAAEDLWPSADYHRQVETLRTAIGETIYLVEVVESPIQLSVHLTGTPYILLGLIDFPRPDPARGLTPHLILLDDGRGLNLGRIARISRRPFDPAPDDLLYLDQATSRHLLFSERRLSREFLARHTRLALGQCLGYPVNETTRHLTGPDTDETTKDAP
ncbi:hypothetical protein THIOKS1470010 [Thiocapsa sp. KS1]|nr:hypothetical protein THIOKS1470010 [Thiocapsa sp. KS1]